jgi:hypothetical protein
MENRGYTKDGSVDLRGRPILAAKTGRWKACGFLVGNYQTLVSFDFFSIIVTTI